jgi:hypothetical protein
MPFFRSTRDILKSPWVDEVHNVNWMDSDKLILPPGGPDDPKFQWDYGREMKIEDVDIWEQLYFQGGGLGVYAAWAPYAEFYMITHWGLMFLSNRIETFYGPEAEKRTYERAAELGIPLPVQQRWIEEDEVWLHQPVPNEHKKLFVDNLKVENKIITDTLYKV